MFLLFSLFSIILYYSVSVVDSTATNGTFYYFAYGSNLLAKRIHMKNPSAVFVSSAKLEKHRFDFNMFIEAWNGAVATIVEDDNETVWGDLWKLDANQMKYLDDQEGVHLGWYYAKNVTVTTPDGEKVLARTYEETTTPNKTAKDEDLPLERRPSNTYLAVIVLGAIESQLPADYIGFLFSFPTNGQMASKKRRKELGYPF